MSRVVPPAQSAVSETAALAREQLLATLHEFRDTVEARFSDGLRTATQRGASLGIKLEEHVLLPALRDAALAPQRIVQASGHDGEVLRDLMDAQAPGLVEKAARRHMRATEMLLHGSEARTALNWTRVQADVQAWLKRWGDEIAARGDIEDEERDPVGLPPR
jgi:hypothetical protein